MAPDSVQYSANGYVEYRPGELNIILSVPHGGSILPPNIPNRDGGGLVDGKCVYRHDIKKDPEKCPVRNKKDVYTRELAIALAAELKKVTGKRPHMVINHLHRLKMDGNADKDKATFGVHPAEVAWCAFHQFISTAKTSIGGRGLLLDIHGQSHPEKMIELGYTINTETLNSGSYTYDVSSIKNLARVNELTDYDHFHDLISGTRSLGGLLQDLGYRVVPSPDNPSPKSRPYYSGGYNTLRHGSRNNGIIDAIQIESPRFLRNKDSCSQYAADLAKALNRYLQLYYN